ncbi:MAG: hypothetical protein HKO66_08060 [Saprospiraceae bacterium]|nr:hypothetical protein [Bacteroidia bacterium]NNE15724.1 hypothetical protein [Saprospiraceae bacterium]NNL92171.1 hypothetical protein [Saprospiraceae bacterium]
MKIRLIFPCILLGIIGFLWQGSADKHLSFQSFEGFISEDEDDYKKFYLLQNESGEIIELKFINEDVQWLSFSEFGYVSVNGHYNKIENYLIVNEIERHNIKSLKPDNHAGLASN